MFDMFNRFIKSTTRRTVFSVAGFLILSFVTMPTWSAAPLDPALVDQALVEQPAADQSANSETATALEDPATPVRIKLATNLGDIILELYPAKAPVTVENFVGYVHDGFYDGTVFHRVIPGFMAQGGGFTVNLDQKPTRAPIQNEADNHLKNLQGTIAMARTSDPHSATAQFFINLIDNPFLDHKNKSMSGWGYTVFGRVVAGMGTVNKMAKIPTGSRGMFSSDVPHETIQIIKAVVL